MSWLSSWKAYPLLALAAVFSACGERSEAPPALSPVTITPITVTSSIVIAERIAYHGWPEAYRLSNAPSRWWWCRGGTDHALRLSSAAPICCGRTRSSPARRPRRGEWDQLRRRQVLAVAAVALGDAQRQRQRLAAAAVAGAVRRRDRQRRGAHGVAADRRLRLRLQSRPSASNPPVRAWSSRPVSSPSAASIRSRWRHGRSAQVAAARSCYSPAWCGRRARRRLQGLPGSPAVARHPQSRRRRAGDQAPVATTTKIGIDADALAWAKGDLLFMAKAEALKSRHA